MTDADDPEALDPVPDRPATLSPPIVTDLLRNRFGYDGLAVTDDLLVYLGVVIQTVKPVESFPIEEHHAVAPI